MGFDLIYKTPDQEFFNEETGEFVDSPGMSLTLQHTLHNLDIWESKHKKRLLGNSDLSIDEYRDYVNIISSEDVSELSDVTISDIINFIMTEQPTATVVNRENNSESSSEFREKSYTSEVLYAYLYLYKIDSEWQYRNLNKFMTLIAVMADLKQGPKKMSDEEVAKQYRSINEQRRAEAEARRNQNGV